MSEPTLLKEFSVVFSGDEGDYLSADALADVRPLHGLVDSPEAEHVATPWPPQYSDGPIVEVADVTEVEALVQAGALAELRRLNSFGHAAGLLFHPQEMKFYAAIYMDDLLWRAMKSPDLDAAEKAFDAFVAQVNQLARSEVRRMQLDAANSHLQLAMAEAHAKAERLRANIARNVAQKQRAAERENELRLAIKKLENDRMQAQLQSGRMSRLNGQLHSTCLAQLPRYRAGVVAFRKR